MFSVFVVRIFVKIALLKGGFGFYNLGKFWFIMKYMAKVTIKCYNLILNGFAMFKSVKNN